MICSYCHGSLLDGRHEIRVEKLFDLEIVFHICPAMGKDNRAWFFVNGRRATPVMIHNIGSVGVA